jgi:hypothetical protein
MYQHEEGTTTQNIHKHNISVILARSKKHHETTNTTITHNINNHITNKINLPRGPFSNQAAVFAHPIGGVPPRVPPPLSPST